MVTAVHENEYLTKKDQDALLGSSGYINFTGKRFAIEKGSLGASQGQESEGGREQVRVPTNPQILQSSWRLADFGAAHVSDWPRRQPGRGQICCAAWIRGFFHPSPREGKLEQGKSLSGTRATHSLAFLSHQPILCLREQVLSQRWPVLGRTGSKTRGWLLP